MHQRFLLPTLICALLLAACGGRQPPEVAEPMPVTDTRDVGAERAADDRLDAERRAEEERRAREARAAAEILAAMVHFDYDRFDIRPDAEATLLEKVGVLRANPAVRLRIDGHADERGSIEYNLALGMRRANAVQQFLIGYGIESRRLEIHSFGKERPLIRESNERAWAMNRRAEFHITAGGDQLAMPGR